MPVLPYDSVLIERLQTGDGKVFDILYKKYSRKLYAFGLKYLKSIDEAEELVQSVFIKIWENYKDLKKEYSFKSYLFTIAYNEICKLFRKRQCQKKYLEKELLTNPVSEEGIDDRITYETALDGVYKLVDVLPDKQKSIFFKSRIDGMSTKEIAREFNLAPGTVDNYISNVLKFIHHHMKKEDFALELFFIISMALQCEMILFF
jgi:RNA polymerase sigma-70 factor (family 1)